MVLGCLLLFTVLLIWGRETEDCWHCYMCAFFLMPLCSVGNNVKQDNKSSVSRHGECVWVLRGGRQGEQGVGWLNRGQKVLSQTNYSAFVCFCMWQDLCLSRLELRWLINLSSCVAMVAVTGVALSETVWTFCFESIITVDDLAISRKSPPLSASLLTIHSLTAIPELHLVIAYANPTFPTAARSHGFQHAVAWIVKQPIETHCIWG